MKFRFLLYSTVLSLAFTGVSTLQAKDFKVTTTEDLEGAPCDAQVCTLRGAVLAANKTAEANQVILSEGTYTLTLLGVNNGADIGEPGDFGDLDATTNNLTIVGAGADKTKIDASGLNPVDNPMIRERILEVASDQNIDVTLRGITFQGGNAGTEDGGALYFGGTSNQLKIESCAFTQNQASEGGAMYVFGLLSPTPVSVVIRQSLFDQNTAQTSAGAVNLLNTKTGIENTTFSGNQAKNVGAIYGVAFGMDSDITLQNVTIAKNQAAELAGGIAVNGAGGNSRIHLGNSILATNEAVSGSPNCRVDAGTIDSKSYNIFGNLSDCAAIISLEKDQTADPKLGDLLDNGGPTLTQALLEGSPALGFGNPAGCAAIAPGEFLKLDQRGQSRPGAGAACDSGAFELGTSDLVVTKASNQTTVGVGNSFLYLLKVVNQGPDLNFNVKLTDVLPTEILTDVNFIQVGSNNPEKKDIVCSVAAGTLTCELGDMVPGEEISLNLPVSLESFPPNGVLHNEAAVVGTELDPNLANNQSTLDLVVTGSANGDGGGGGCSLGTTASMGFTSWTWLGLLLLGSLGLRLKRR